MLGLRQCNYKYKEKDKHNKYKYKYKGRAELVLHLRPAVANFHTSPRTVKITKKKSKTITNAKAKRTG